MFLASRWPLPPQLRASHQQRLNYRKRDDGDLEASNTTTDPCRRICGRDRGRAGGCRRRRTLPTRRRRSRHAPAANPRTPSPVHACPIWCRIPLRLAKPRRVDCRRLTTFHAPEPIPASASGCPRNSKPKARCRCRTRRSARARNPDSRHKAGAQQCAPAFSYAPQTHSQRTPRMSADCYSAFVQSCQRVSYRRQKAAQ